MSWQPIETAPTDQLVLVYVPGKNPVGLPCAPFQTVAFWDDLQACWRLAECGGYAESDDLWPNPSHWMPLPEPPK